ncbi:GtrA family protein [Ramlibacter sp. AN1015]|uniref:GtrA family protein n=1 Tax=Ramlibacter sp. AN1015 TaxID=3133428 RepID=UPI0030C54767
MLRRPLAIQVARFAVVGVLSNVVLYAGYLALTWLGMPVTPAVTLLYALGALQTFILNKRWTFSCRASRRSTVVRYYVSYACGYALNLVTLEIGMNRLGFPHQHVQAVAIVAVAIFLFLLQRSWVFRGAEATLVHPTQ